MPPNNSPWGSHYIRLGDQLSSVDLQAKQIAALGKEYSELGHVVMSTGARQKAIKARSELRSAVRTRFAPTTTLMIE